MTNKWMTSGASRLKANLNRSFGARRNQKQKAAASATSHTSFVVAATAKSAVSSSSSLSRKKNHGKGKLLEVLGLERGG